MPLPFLPLRRGSYSMSASSLVTDYLQVNVLYLLPAWLGSMTSHPLIKTHPDRSSLALIVYGTPHVPFKYKRRMRSAGFRDVIYGKTAIASERSRTL